MYFRGKARLNRKTKNLIKELNSKEIAIIDHADLDKVSAEALLEKRVEVIINAQPSITGRYPNQGPFLLCSYGIHFIDNVGEDIFSKVDNGDELTIDGGKIFRDGEFLTEGDVLDLDTCVELMEKAKVGLGAELEKFAANTLEYIKQEKDFFFEKVELPEIETVIKGKHTMVVVRGHDYRADLKVLKPYIREIEPILIGVDGGADALIAEGLQPHIIIGDMDSVSEEALASGAELIVHAYPDGEAPGLVRIKNLNLTPQIFKAPGTSEDIALLLAHEMGAELIVAVGTHANLIEFLDKGRKGMASTFLVRLRVGSKLVDAKGVSKLYKSTIKFSHLLILLAAALITVMVIILVSPTIKALLRLIIWNVRLWIGI